jgi:hypothetical protein
VQKDQAGGWKVQDIAGQISGWQNEFETLGFSGMPYLSPGQMAEAAASAKKG